MRETPGYPFLTRGGAAVVLSTLALALGLVACGDDEAPIGGASTPADSPPQAAPSDTYRLSEGGEALITPSGKRIPVDAKLVTGYVDAARQTGSYLDMSGWAGPADLSGPAQTIVAIVGTESVLTKKPSVSRPDLVDGYKRPGLEKAGFVFSLPKSSLKCSAPDGGLKTFAVAGDAATRMEWLSDVGQQVAEAC